MINPTSIDGVLIQWGDRLFYPGNRIVSSTQPRLTALATSHRAAAMRGRIRATVVRRAPQVMVKVTGGGRGMKAIAAHFRYISKNGRLDIEDDEGNRMRGKDALRGLVDDWRYGGGLIEDVSPRREALNIILSMPRGTDPLSVQWAAREFARRELADHKYVMVLHDHQANPHVHISVRVESKHGRRLSPRKADLHRWREVFAEKLRERGVDAEATRQATRGVSRRYPDIWQIKALEEGRLKRGRSGYRAGPTAVATRLDVGLAWQNIGAALAQSPDVADRKLATAIGQFTCESGLESRSPGREPTAGDSRARVRTRSGPPR